MYLFLFHFLFTIFSGMHMCTVRTGSYAPDTVASFQINSLLKMLSEGKTSSLEFVQVVSILICFSNTVRPSLPEQHVMFV